MRTLQRKTNFHFKIRKKQPLKVGFYFTSELPIWAEEFSIIFTLWQGSWARFAHRCFTRSFEAYHSSEAKKFENHNYVR